MFYTSIEQFMFFTKTLKRKEKHMESSSTIQLQFRSGDDLFNNYSIGIIRQVVDKSEYVIDMLLLI